MAGIGPPGPGESLEFHRACRRLAPHTGGCGGLEVGRQLPGSHILVQDPLPRDSAELFRSLEVLDRGRNTGTGPKTICLYLFVGTAPGILGLASSGLGADVGPNIDDSRPDA